MEKQQENAIAQPELRSVLPRFSLVTRLNENEYSHFSAVVRDQMQGSLLLSVAVVLLYPGIKSL